MTPANKQLDQYRSMRDFALTPEPSGDADPASPDAPRFVVQEHHATALHWDFRLERDGVLVSWAVPMGVPPDPRENHLAVHTEDHPLSYLTFEGDIPEGEYGGGKVIRWDLGTYECEKWEEREVIVTLHGSRVRGKYVLFRTRGRDWMMHRMDPPEDPTREPMPETWRPMRATRGRFPRAVAEFAFEPRWSGQRVVVAAKGGRIHAFNAEGDDISASFPELRAFGRSLGAVEVVLDGVLVAADGSTDGDALLQRRRAKKSDAAVARIAEHEPVTIVVFDVVWLEGHATGDLTYRDRRRLLDELGIAGRAWRTSPSLEAEGETMRDAARAQGLRGVVGKRLDSGYAPGTTTRDWIEVVDPS